MEARNRRLRELVRRDPRHYFWGAVVDVLVELGWRPPPPAERAMDAMLEDLGVQIGKLGLSPLQARILELLADGKERKEIAAALHMGEETVKTRQAQVYRRLGARNAPHAVAIAFRAGVLV